MSTYGFVLWVALAVAPTYAEAGITIEQLGNLTYAGIYDHPVTLRNGAYTGEPMCCPATSVRNAYSYRNEELVLMTVESAGQ